MSAFTFFRRCHKWVALAVALPLLVIFTTGIALSISPKVRWLQPQAAAVPGAGIQITFEQALAAARTVPQAGIRSWSDVAQIDARPKTGVVRLRASNYWEVQVDGHSGAVLGAARRWKTLLILLHDGSWFASWAKYGVFLPAGVGAWVLWMTGIAIWLISTLKKKKKGKA